MVRTWKIKIPALSGAEERLVYLYLPENWEHSGQRYPVMYMFDGHNVFFDSHATYGKSWGMGEYLDENHKQLIVVAVECTHNGNARLSEYSPLDFEMPEVGSIKGRGKEYMDWLIGTLKPMIDANYPTLPAREYTTIAGSSMGGLMSLYAVCEYNDVFGKAACISPSFWVAKDRVLDIVANSEVASDSSIYIDYGSLELPNHANSSEALFSVARLLLTKRVNVVLKIVPGGMHNESSWQKQIPAFMEYLGL